MAAAEHVACVAGLRRARVCACAAGRRDMIMSTSMLRVLRGYGGRLARVRACVRVPWRPCRRGG
eukprot:6644411-Prymnesium_polylepis.1